MNQQFLNINQIRFVENYAKENSINLIENAGKAVANHIMANYKKTTRILFVVGKGNNGTDGLAAAINLLKHKYKLDILRLFKTNTESNDNYFEQIKLLKRPLTRLPIELSRYDLIVDAIYGIGLINDMEVEVNKIFAKINTANCQVISLDAPSGINPFTGKVCGNAIYADTTLTFIADKAGLHTGDGIDYSGNVIVSNLIDLAEVKFSHVQQNIQFNLLNTINYQLLRRVKLNTNKGDFGTIAIIGGDKGMHGALYLAGRAALQLGAGKVVLGAIDDDFHLDYSVPELMYNNYKQIIKGLQAYDVIAVGPGFGHDNKSVKILKKIFEQLGECKLIIDADALNIIATNQELKIKFKNLRNKIITPHPGEAARLLAITVNDIQENRFVAASDLSNMLNSLVVLKGAGTIIQEDDTSFINTTGNPALANAGQGDVLTGIIASFAAQGLNLIDAARLAVYIHGLAADKLVSRKRGYTGILASDIINEARDLINQLLYENSFFK